MRYEDLGKVAKGVRWHFHDDIAVVMIFQDPNSKLFVGIGIFTMILLSPPLWSAELRKIGRKRNQVDSIRY